MHGAVRAAHRLQELKHNVRYLGLNPETGDVRIASAKGAESTLLDKLAFDVPLILHGLSESELPESLAFVRDKMPAVPPQTKGQ